MSTGGYVSGRGRRARDVLCGVAGDALGDDVAADDPPEGAGGRSSHGLMVREKTRQVGATMTNMALSVQRRFQNVVQDGDKQLQLDLFVGREVLDAS